MQTKKPFDPKEHFIQIKSGYGDSETISDYLPVQQRLVWFREECPDGTIETRIEHIDFEAEFEEKKWKYNREKKKSEPYIDKAKGVVIFHAVVTTGKGGVAHGTKMEKAVSFGDWIEKAESGAIGRALAALGYGTQFSGREWDESYRIVDSPLMGGENREGKGDDQAPEQDQQPSRLDALKEKYNTYFSIFGIKHMTAFGERALQCPLDLADEKTIRRALDGLRKANFLLEMAKVRDPEYKRLGEVFAGKGIPVDHPLDMMGREDQEKLILEYFTAIKMIDKNLAKDVKNDGKLPEAIKNEYNDLLTEWTKKTKKTA